jgi:hypothetical protein
MSSSGDTSGAHTMLVEQFLSDSPGDLELHFKSHFNWSWVVDSVLDSFNCESRIIRCQSVRDLPAYSTKFSRRFSLFRVEVFSPTTLSWAGCWATSAVFEFLDPKDELWRSLNSCGVSEAMPRTVLLPWDCTTLTETPEFPCLLKAALGAGGHGIYFVEDESEALTVVQNHAEKARENPEFLDKLLSEYGDVPSWSLQNLFPTIRVRDDKKCQVRCYVVFSNNSLFLHNEVEVRVPSWDSVVGENLSSHEEACCNGSNARPYNYGRRKVDTDRVLLNEVPELQGSQAAILGLMSNTFIALKSSLEMHISRDKPGDSLSFQPNEIAVAGVDLLVDTAFNVVIVEVNNNPALPSADKKMSNAYSLHVHELVREILWLGLTRSTEGTKFSQLW